MSAEISIQELSARAEAFLFSEGGSLTTRKLAQLLECSEGKLEEALHVLEKRLEGGGVSLVKTQMEVTLVTSPTVSEALEKAFERELSREIGDAGLEVLAIVLYRGPSTRAQIDYIRGVNTSSTLRTLLARGLVERAGNPNDAREYLYRPTTELLAHLGITGVNDIPERAEIAAQLDAFEAKNEQPQNTYDGRTIES